jgi:hypothetical protein
MSTTTLSPETLTADALLGIHEPERVFAANFKEIATLYHRLAKIWYPDQNKSAQARAVFEHIVALKNSAEKKLTDGTWQEPGCFTCRLANGKLFKVRSDARRDFDLGTMHISPTTVTYVISKEYETLFRNALANFAKLPFADDKMKKMYATRLPTTFKTYETTDSLIVTVRKAKDEVLLRDLIPHLKKERLDCHAAWITSRLIEMVRYLDYAGLSHNAITPDTVFVSPQGHSISLLGGWWYAKPLGQQLDFVPGEAIDYLPQNAGTTPAIATLKVDLEMVRATSREILGDRGGTRLSLLKTAPEPVLTYLRTPSSGDPQNDLATWYEKIMPQAFGPRRFTELKVTYSDIYQPGG